MKRVLFSPRGCAIILAALCAGGGLSFAQIAFERIYGGTKPTSATSVRQTFDGGYIIAGSTTSSSGGKSDVCLIKTDHLGDTLWTRSYGGSSDEGGSCAEQTSDGGYIIAVTGQLGPYPDYSFNYLLKIDHSGDSLWMTTSRVGYAFSVQQTSDLGYIVTGEFGFNPQVGRSAVSLVKTDSTGATIWTKGYACGTGYGVGYNQGRSVRQTSDGGYIVAGYTKRRTSVFLPDDIYLVKTDASGDSLWTKSYGGNAADQAHSVQQTSDGGYVIAGYTTFSGSTQADVYLLKTDSSGDTLWTRTFGGPAQEYGHCIEQTVDGGYIIAGTTTSFGAGYSDVYLIKTNSLGDTLWTRTYGGPYGEYAGSVQQTSDGGYIIAGGTASFSADSSYRAYLIKTRADGLVVSTGDEKNALPIEFALQQNFPNPFNPSTTIRYGLPKRSHVTLTVFNILGQRVAQLVNEEVGAGYHEVKFDGRGLASGVFLCRMTADGHLDIKKLLLVK